MILETFLSETQICSYQSSLIVASGGELSIVGHINRFFIQPFSFAGASYPVRDQDLSLPNSYSNLCLVVEYTLDYRWRSNRSEAHHIYWYQSCSGSS